MASWKTVGIGGGFVTNDALRNHPITDTIASIEVGEYDGQPQLILTTLTSNQKIALNKHSCELWEELYGEDYSAWLNQPFKASLQMVKVMGKLAEIKVITPTRPAPAAARKGKR